MSQNSSPAELREIGLKVTAPRIKVLEFFQQNPSSHYSAEEVYMALSKDDSDIGIATVYRVLTQFEQAGLLSRSQFEGGKALYELNDGQHHDHLVCLDCGHVEEFFDTEIENRQHAIARQLGFEIADHALSLYAICRKNPCPNRPSPQ